jgi:RNA polymerase primary sigma factor
MAKPITRPVRTTRTPVRPSRKRHLRRREDVRAEPAVSGEAKVLSLPVPANDIIAPASVLRVKDVKDPKKAKAKSSGASDDHLTTYFRDLAEHDLLGPEDERELSQGIEDQEVLAWERLFGHPDGGPRIVEIIKDQLETPVSFEKVLRAAEIVRGKRKDTRSINRLAAAAREVAEKVRAADLDRVHVDAAVRDIDKARAAALAGEHSWIPNAATKQFGEYVDGVHQAHRDGASLRDEFVRANLRLVVTMARRYDRGGMPLADLIQEGNLGLMHAVSRFDYRRGLRFSTYACWWIRHAIGRALADKARAVRIPVHMLEAQQQLEKVRQSLIGELGRPPTPQELAKAARVPLAKLNQMHRYIMGQPMSLDRPMHDDDDRAFGDMLADPATEDASPADDMTTQALSQQVTRLLHHLTPIEADVLRKRFGLTDDEERTFREIGDEYHLSRERIRQIQNAALDKLKRAMEREHMGTLDT